MNALIDAVNALRIHAGPGIRVNTTPSGITITAERQPAVSGGGVKQGSSPSTTAEQRPIWIVKILSGTPTTGYSCTVINDLGYTDTSALGMTFFPVLTYSSGATLPANTVCLAVASKTAATESQSTPPAEPEE